MTTLYYRGRRMLNDGKLGETFVRADDIDDILIFVPKKRLALSIGRAYDVEEPEAGRFHLGSATLDQELPQHANAAEWRTLALQAEAELDAAKARTRVEKAAKDENKDLAELTLGELREMFARSLPDQKAALMTVITRYVRPY